MGCWPRCGKMGKKKGIYQPNNTVVIINMAKKVVQPKLVPTNML